MKKSGKHSKTPLKLLRKQRITFMLNEKEYNVINNYLIKYKISNRSQWYRETLIAHILSKLEQDYPTLFGENEMRR